MEIARYYQVPGCPKAPTAVMLLVWLYGKRKKHTLLILLNEVMEIVRYCASMCGHAPKHPHLGHYYLCGCKA
jgi:hypothetical protein